MTYEEKKRTIDKLTIILAVIGFVITPAFILTLMKKVYGHAISPGTMLAYEIILAAVSLFTGAAITLMFFKLKGRTISKPDDISQVLREEDILNDEISALSEFGDLYVLKIDLDLNIFKINSNAEKLFERVEPAYRNSIRSIITHDELSDPDIMAVLKGGKSLHTFSMESWHRGPDEPRILKGILKPVKDIEHEIASGMILLVDLTNGLKKELRITELENYLLQVTLTSEERIEEALRANEKLRYSVRILSDTFIAAPTGLIIIDKNGIITNCNRASENIFDFHERAVTGKNLDKLFTNRSITDDILSNAELGQNVEHEVDCLRGDLSHFVGKLKAKPVFDDKHNVIRYVVSIDDITKRTKLEKYILLKNQELSSVNDIFMSTNQFNSLDKKLNVFMDKLFDNLEIVRKGLVYLKTDSESLELCIYKGFHFAMLKELQNILYSKTLCGYSLENEMVVISENVDLNELPEITDMLSEKGVSENHIYLPILYKGEQLGVLVIFPNKGYHFEHSDIEFLDMVREELGICVKQALRYEELKKNLSSSHGG